jgi:Sec-independent protein secretion pathway component TatC
MAKLGDTVKGARVLSARVRAAEGADPEGRMSLIEHIRELRNRLLKICLALVAGTAIGLIPKVFDRVWGFIEQPSVRPRSTATTAVARSATSWS